MLYSLLMQEEESKYWYRKLEKFASSAKGGQKREAIGLPEIAFAAVGLTVRLDTLQGEIQTAKEVLSSFEKSVRDRGQLCIVLCGSADMGKEGGRGEGEIKTQYLSITKVNLLCADWPLYKCAWRKPGLLY